VIHGAAEEAHEPPVRIQYGHTIVPGLLTGPIFDALTTQDL